MFNRLNHGSIWRATRRIRRAALSLMVAGSLSSIGLASIALAADAAATKIDAQKPSGGISIIVHRFDANAHVPFVDFPAPSTHLAAIGTHDSLPIVPAAKAITRTSAKYGELVSSLIATTALQAGIPLQPMLEPFAMVSTIRSEPNPAKPAIAPESDRQAKIDQVVAEVEAFNRWWLGEPELIAPPAQSAPISEVDIDAMIDALAQTEPIDVQHLDSSSDTLVGSAAMIVTIEEPYQPYDLADSDLTTLPLVFDVNQPIPLYQPAPAATSFGPSHYVLSPSGRDALALPDEPVQAEFMIASNASPDCILDQLIWDATTWANKVDLEHWDGATLGRAIGTLAVQGHTRQIQWTRSIVQHLPSFLHRNQVAPGELKLAQEIIPVPVADPLPDADPAVFDTAMFLLSESTDPLTAVLLPVPDELPNAQWSDYADEIQSVTQIVVNLRDGLLEGWNQIAKTSPVNAPEQRVAEKDDESSDF